MAGIFTWIIVAALFFAGIYMLAVAEQWFYQGKLELLHPLRSFIRLLLQEDLEPGQRDRVFYETAPILFVAAVLGAFAVLPLSGDLVIVDMATGSLFFNAALAYIMVAMVMAGWSANGVYAMIGGWRFLAQLVAYSMPVVMTITATVMRAESISLLRIVESQQPLWNVVYQPVGFILFYLSAMALSFLPPFDLPVSRGELAGGVWAEFTGFRLMIFKTARLMLILTLSLATVILFFGGWYGPWLPGSVWVILKTLIIAISYIAAGKRVSRIHHDQLLMWSWKIGTPAALFNIFYVGVILLI